jgi:hypothetical protein
MNFNPVLGFFSKYRLPLDRQGKDLLNFLGEHFCCFESDLRILLKNPKYQVEEFEKEIFDELKEKQETIYSFSRAILDSLSAYIDGNALKAQEIFQRQLEEIQDSILSSSINVSNGLRNRLFRIRPHKEHEKCTGPVDLFHIPFEKAKLLAKNYRYSISGFPCLYLSGSPTDTGLTLAWFECEQPEKFYWSEFILSDYNKTIELIDFTWSPFLNAIKANNYQTWILNKEPFVKDLFVNYIFTYPLLASCSLKAIEKEGGSYVPEYIIPQMLLEWIRANGKYRGIKYYSCTRFDEAQKYNAFNIVLFPQENTLPVGHCPRLKYELKVSIPELTEISDITLLKAKERKTQNFYFIDDKLCQE